MPRAYYFVVVVTALTFLLLSVKAVTAAGQLTGDDEEALKADLLAQLQSQDTGSSSLINEEEGGGGVDEEEATVQITMTFVNEFPDRVRVRHACVTCVNFLLDFFFWFLTYVVYYCSDCRPLTYIG